MIVDAFETSSESNDDRESLSQLVKQISKEAGFDLTGIAPAVTPTGFHPLIGWLDKGYHADMDWMTRRQDAYRHPENVLNEVRSVIMVAMNYHNHTSQNAGAARISSYAWGSFDYHSVLRDRLKAVAGTIHQHVPGARTRAIVDTAPLLERDFGRLSGIGWFGKNTMLISRQIGSWFFLGALLTTAELAYDQAVDTDYCGTCDRCLRACPTDAFPAPHVLDANRCISYLTIERRDKSVPVDLREGIGDWLFGCDICQEVCPWNRFAPEQSDQRFELLPRWRNLDPVELLTMTDAVFNERFSDTPMNRTGRSAMIRNAIIVIANQHRTELCPQLRMCLTDTEPLVRGATAWALATLNDVDSLPHIEDCLKSEDDEDVLREFSEAIAWLSAETG